MAPSGIYPEPNLAPGQQDWVQAAGLGRGEAWWPRLCPVGELSAGRWQVDPIRASCKDYDSAVQPGGGNSHAELPNVALPGPYLCLKEAPMLLTFPDEATARLL